MFSWVVAAYLILQFMITMTSLIQRRSSDNGTMPILGLSLLTLAYVIAYLGMIITTVIVTKSNPTDPTVAFERAISKVYDEETASYLQDLAEYHCNICKTSVIEGTKHCGFCNRCTTGFDHHCRWVSNDIGRFNYIQFIRMLLFVLATQILQIVTCSLGLSQAKNQNSSGGEDNDP